MVPRSKPEQRKGDRRASWRGAVRNSVSAEAMVE